jgi:hypothetical protein
MLENVMITDNSYQLLYDAYTGSGGFVDGSYLFRHKREDDEDFLKRKRMARYSNFVKVIVNALTNPIFKKTIVRDFESNKMMEDFMDDVDGKGTPINIFIKRAAKWARVYNRIFIVEDNYTAEQMVGNKEDAMQNRQFPYLYIVRPDQVVDYTCDKSGRFLMFSYKVRAKMSKNDLKANSSYEEWTWTPETWSCKTDDKLVSEGENSIGIVPVVALSASDEQEDNPLPVPDMLHIARANRDIYNRDSEKREILRNQCFPVLVYPMTPQMAAQARQRDENGNEIGLNIGTNNMMNVDASASAMPEFIAPPMEPVNVLQQEIKDIIDDMFRQAGLTSVLAIQTKQSGVAKQWDFEETTNILADMAENCEMAETGIFHLFEAWTKTEVKDLKVKYPRNFNITDIVDELDKAQKMKDLVVGGTVVEREVNRKIAEVYFADVDDKRYAEIMNEIETMPPDRGMVQSEE